MARENQCLLHVEDMKIYYPVAGKKLGTTDYVKAVDGVSFDVRRGEVFGIVGESGCGKSTLGRGICKLEKPTGGTVILDGEDISGYNDRQMRPVRKKVQMVFQDPYASLNPRMSVFDIIAEPLVIHNLARNKGELEEKVLDLLRKVGLDDYHANRYPHEFSGGQRQRMVIARALVLGPEFVVCDEPVSALDVSVRSQVINLMADLQRAYHLTYLFISHDLSVIRHICGRVAVMYLGQIVEMTDTDTLFERPLHPYTQALLSAIPIPDVGTGRRRQILRGDVLSPIDPPKGCRFHTRCPYASERCRDQAPELKQVEEGHLAACFRCGGAEQ